MRLLLINTNTTEAITTLLLDSARRLVDSSVVVTGATARFGARYIASRSAYAIAGHAALDAYTRHGREVDAVIVACFGDPGLLALREIAPVPVVGMAEASCRVAASRGRFAIVTGGAAWVPMLREFVAMLGLERQLAGVRAVAPTGAAIAADPQGSYVLLANECQAAVREDGAEVVILGGAGLVGIAEKIAGHVSVPLIDCLAAAIAVAQNGVKNARSAGTPPVFPYPVESIGLSDPLATMLAGHPAGTR